MNKHPSYPRIVSVLLGTLVLGAWPCAAQSSAPPSPPAGQSLDQAADDPTASLMSVQWADWYTARFHGISGEDANTMVMRAAVPFATGELSHIFRATVPFVTDHPVLDTGLSDITLFDLVVFNESWGRWGVGPVVLLPAGGSSRGSEKWAAGPAVGFTAHQGKLLYGLFNQNLFSFAGDDARTDISASILQPIVSYGLGGGWSVGASEMTVTYDWEGARWSSLPLGAKVAKMLTFGGTPVQVSLQYEHDFADDAVGPADTIRLTFKFLFPTH